MPIGGLQILLALKRIALIEAGFVINERDGQATLRGFHLTCLVQAKTFSQIMRAADVKSLVCFGSQHINIVHSYFTGRVYSPTG